MATSAVVFKAEEQVGASHQPRGLNKKASQQAVACVDPWYCCLADLHQGKKVSPICFTAPQWLARRDAGGERRLLLLGIIYAPHLKNILS